MACMPALHTHSNRRRWLNADSRQYRTTSENAAKGQDFLFAHIASLRALQKRSAYREYKSLQLLSLLYTLTRQGNQLLDSVCLFRVLIHWKQRRCWWFSYILCEWIQPEFAELPVHLWLSRWVKCSTLHKGIKQSAGMKQSELRHFNNSGL